MPGDKSEWLIQDEDRMISKSCAYYISLKSYPETANLESVRVKIPRQNKLTVESLGHLMLQASSGCL